jgi:hypothetical protein
VLALFPVELGHTADGTSIVAVGLLVTVTT